MGTSSCPSRELVLAPFQKSIKRTMAPSSEVPQAWARSVMRPPPCQARGRTGRQRGHPLLPGEEPDVAAGQATCSSVASWTWRRLTAWLMALRMKARSWANRWP